MARRKAGRVEAMEDGTSVITPALSRKLQKVAWRGPTDGRRTWTPMLIHVKPRGARRSIGRRRIHHLPRLEPDFEHGVRGGEERSRSVLHDLLSPCSGSPKEKAVAVMRRLHSGHGIKLALFGSRRVQARSLSAHHLAATLRRLQPARPSISAPTPNRLHVAGSGTGEKFR